MRDPRVAAAAPSVPWRARPHARLPRVPPLSRAVAFVNNYENMRFPSLQDDFAATNGEADGGVATNGNTVRADDSGSAVGTVHMARWSLLLAAGALAILS